MIFFYGEGRLGNQIFQYQALNRIAAVDESIYSIGLEDLDSVFDSVGRNVRVVTRNDWLKHVVKYLIIPALVRPLARYLRLFNYAYEPEFKDGAHCGMSGEYRLQLGAFKHLTFVDGGYYQNAELSNPIFPVPSLTVRQELRTEARRFIDTHVPRDLFPVFVHIRRGDYLRFSSFGVRDLVLPESFFRSAIREARRRQNDSYFVFVTDDSEWVRNTFSDISDKTIASFNPRLDFSIMTECRGAILSNSTFSLAAALLMREPEIVIGPRYWLGFRVNRWLPPRIQFDNPKLVYISVLPESSPS